MTRYQSRALADAREAGLLQKTGDGIGFFLLSESPTPKPVA